MPVTFRAATFNVENLFSRARVLNMSDHLQAETILKASADDLGAVGWDPVFGQGRVNAERAVLLARAAGEVFQLQSGQQPAPTWWASWRAAASGRRSG